MLSGQFTGATYFDLRTCFMKGVHCVAFLPLLFCMRLCAHSYRKNLIEKNCPFRALNVLSWTFHCFHSPGVFRHYQGLDMRNFQTARPVAPPVPIYDVPIYRQLATIPNPDQARLIRSLNLCRESHRFQTFTGEWPREAAPSPEDMAASGWFYLGNLDRTQCFCCGGVLRNWRRLDNPNSEHIRHFSHCLMAQGHERRNIEDTGRQVSMV